MPSVIINNLFKLSELVKVSNPYLDAKIKPSDESYTPNRNLLFERKVIQIKCKYQVINQLAKQNYFLQLHEGTGWDIYWTDRQFLSARHLKSLMPYQRINYFPGMSILTNKQNLTQRLNLFRQRFPEDYDFFPRTWVVKKATDETRKETINTFAITLADSILKEALNVFSPVQKMILKPINTIPISQDSTEDSKDSSTSQDNDCIPDLENNHLSCDHTAFVSSNSTRSNSLNSDTELQIDKTISVRSAIVRTPLRDTTNLVDLKEVSSPVATKMVETKTIENSKQTKINETNKFSENTKKTIERNNKRITTVTQDDEMSNKLRSLGIKSNVLFQTNLRSTKNSKKDLKNTPNKTLTGILLKDNVKSFVNHLNRTDNIDKGNDNQIKGKDKIPKTNETQNNEPNECRKPSKAEKIKDEVEDSNKDSQSTLEISAKNAIQSVKKESLETKKNVRESAMESDSIYIFKPCDGCQGKGIRLAMNMKQLLNNMEFDAMICQEYIKHPLLWNGYKFDIRFYVLITSVKQLRVYIYNEGIVRLATERYEQPNESNIDNMFMHLTNYSINKDSENFNQEFSKQSLESMNKFLQNEHGVDLTSLYERIHDIIVKTILTGHRFILNEYLDTFKHHVHREACFQLLGFDIILDNQCNPVLLEINKNASLKRPTPIDKIIKTKLTRDLFSILNLNENRLRGDILRDNLNSNTYSKRYIEHELVHRGDFNMIYPCVGIEKYSKYIID